MTISLCKVNLSHSYKHIHMSYPVLWLHFYHYAQGVQRISIKVKHFLHHPESQNIVILQTAFIKTLSLSLCSLCSHYILLSELFIITLSRLACKHKYQELLTWKQNRNLILEKNGFSECCLHLVFAFFEPITTDIYGSLHLY